MSDKTAIQWTDATWSPVTGCTKVSEGCRHCYIERTPPFRVARRRFVHPRGGDPGDPGATTGVLLHPDRLDQPLRWRKPRRVFVCSMADLFHDEVPDEFIARVFAIMRNAPQHTFQVLTKRPARMRSWLTRCASWQGWITHNGAPPEKAYDGGGIIVGDEDHWPLPNVWLGTSVEDQKAADLRIPKLLETPGAVRFLSCEPLLGPVDLRHWLPDREDRGWGDIWQLCQDHGVADCTQSWPCRGLGWVIVGGESGPGARPMHPQWARDLRDQCQAAGIAYFFKQVGGRTPTAGGRELDGRTWDEMPAVAS